jgi:hypothetical protein
LICRHLLAEGLLALLETSLPSIRAATGGRGQPPIEIAMEADRHQRLDGVLVGGPACLVDAVEVA